PIPDYAEESFHDEYAEQGARPLGEAHPEPSPTPTGSSLATATVTDTETKTEAVAPAAEAARTPAQPVGFTTVLGIILLPIALILLQTFSSLIIDDPKNPVQQVLGFIGPPLMALFIAALASFYVLGIRRGWSKEHLVTVAESALKPVGMILLVVGGGGVFGSILVARRIRKVLSSSLTSPGPPLIVLAFVISLTLRIAQGSATVAIVATPASSPPWSRRRPLPQCTSRCSA